MKENELTKKQYDQKYSGKYFYWTTRPSSTCFEVLRRMPPERPLKLLDIGCGEGRNAMFFARNGYEVHAFDLSEKGVEKTKRFADQARVAVHVFRADLKSFDLQKHMTFYSRRARSILPIHRFERSFLVITRPSRLREA
jgi:2-polyprenyl-3-methyl-5-hydroxy-6-metoxy-1,4-benzoquinol methylase